MATSASESSTSNTSSQSNTSSTSSTNDSGYSGNNGFSIGNYSSQTANSNTDSGAPSETSVAHGAGVAGPGLENGNFGSAWSSDSGGSHGVGAGGNGSGTWGSYDSGMDFMDKGIVSGGGYFNAPRSGVKTISGEGSKPVSYSAADGSRGFYVDTEHGTYNVNETTGTVTTMNDETVGSFNKNGTFIPAKGVNLPQEVIDDMSKDYAFYQDKWDSVKGSLTEASKAEAKTKDGETVDINETPTGRPNVQTTNGIKDADIEGTTHLTEGGFNNDKAQSEIDQQYKDIDETNNENKTNYNRDVFNRGMKEVSTESVSDERCKKFVSTCIKHEPFARQGVKKIVEIIRSK